MKYMIGRKLSGFYWSTTGILRKRDFFYIICFAFFAFFPFFKEGGGGEVGEDRGGLELRLRFATDLK